VRETAARTTRRWHLRRSVAKVRALPFWATAASTIFYEDRKAGTRAHAHTQQHVKAKKRVLASTGESRVGVVRLMRAASLLVLLQVLVA